MTTRSHSLNVIASMALFVMIGVGLASCGGGGSKAAPGNTGDEIIIEPRPPQDSPDLTVVSPSASDNNPAAGASFTLSATVSNAGDGESAATTLRYYRSTDGTITTSDTEVGTDAVAGLAASGSDSQSVELVVPSAPGPYYYGACVETVAGESDTTNNCSTAVQVTVPAPERPDLMVVSPSVSNNSPTVGSQFTLSATVRNTGGGESAATTLRYYQSVDGTITTSDTEVGTDAVAGLVASVSDSQAVELAAPSAPGPYHYGACVDAVAGESDTANNCSPSVQVTVREPDHPDLMVVSPSVSDNIPAPGVSFTLSATVQNDGNGESAGTTLRYYRSTDGTITTSDTEVGTDAVGGLAPSGSDSQSVELAAPSAPGPYHYGACVDAVAGESDTANNCSPSVQVTVREPDHPDLMVVSPSVSDNIPAPGVSFTLSATVQNDGNGESAGTTLRYYRSTDGTITTSDTEVGTDAVGGLAPSGSDSQSVELAAPSAPGTYYYGACVDAVAGESDTANNCSPSVQVTVLQTVLQTQQQLQSRPDLEVGTPTVSDDSPAPGASFTLSATVQNDGNGESAATTLRYFRSTDATITTSDTEVGTDAVAGLARSGSDSQSVDVAAPSVPGPYYYGGCVDVVAGESNTANNCSPSVQVTVLQTQQQLQSRPDLEVGTPTVSDSRPAPEASFTLSATVQNDGNGESAATTLRYFRSTDATITTSDTEVGTDTVAGLAPSGSDSQSVELAAPSAPGPYYYGVCVDAVAGESNTADNCSTSVRVTVLQTQQQLQGRPDLEVGTPTVSDDSPAPGASFTLSATVQNDGNGESAATTLRYFRSTDATITTSDTEVGTDAVVGLAASGSDSQSVELVAPSAPGPYHYGACVDTVAGESDTGNNCSTAVQVTVLVTATQIQGSPDLEVGTPTVSDTSPETGASFTLSATVSNAGDGGSVATTLRYYRSTDATITTTDTAVGTGAVVALGALGTSAQSISLTAPATAGAYYYGACVDAVAGESDTRDNCSGSVKVDVEAPKHPDLEVGTPTVSDTSPETGASFTLSATVSNAGDGGSVATTLRYYRSTDATITRSDTAVGTDAVGALGASGTSAQSISLTAPAPAEAYYYGACVDVVTSEADTANNCSVSVEVTVLVTSLQLTGQPDLEVGTPRVDNASPETGATFTLSATVSNTGDGESPATTLRFYSSTDATITTSDTFVGSDTVVVLAASGSSSVSVDLTAPASPGTYYYGACVDAVTDETNSANNCSSSVQVTVTAPLYPDLTISTIGGSSDAIVGESFTLFATVSNAGNGESPATTLRFYSSTDATITTVDTAVVTKAVAGLAASGSSSVSVDLTAPASPGTYYYGACVDAVTGETDTANNCSSSVQVTVSAGTQLQEVEAPDLVVGTPTVSDSSPEPGAAFTLSATVSNTGDGESPATTLRYYRSVFATITTAVTAVGTKAVAGLAASGSSAESISLTAPYDPTLTYYYHACVDSVTDESDTNNNCAVSVAVTVSPPNTPELVMTNIGGDYNGNTGTFFELNQGDTFTITVVGRNVGGVDAPATTLRIYQSTDSTITTSDTEVDTSPLSGITASGGVAQSLLLDAPSSSGTYYYGACVDSVAGETVTTNNCIGAVSIIVTAP